jgi:hypothetical protein
VSLVRVIYIIPSDAEPWPEAKSRANDVLEDLQWFFADEMDRLGHGRKTFGIARDANGSLLFYQINGEFDKKSFLEANKKEYPGWCRDAATRCGLFANSYITVHFIEAYNITAEKVSANCCGWANYGGEAFLSSLHLKLAKRDWIALTNSYAGKFFEEIGAELRIWNDRGPELGDLSGAGYGVIAHELAHCFSPAPQEKGGRGRSGPLMGRGQVGMRGYFRPDLTGDKCFLRKEDGEALNNNNHFALRLLKPRSVK